MTHDDQCRAVGIAAHQNRERACRADERIRVFFLGVAVWVIVTIVI
ncbi:hypothetical protein RM533_01915 [Croceicoccus sp. F390]|uniref:Uncharacterized protein n=1 Tax=Croceicoccus esteveae TaxID=3075597 RepID=A0ABU2ZHP8_9SPHN|nr:hypothetical protein [Croceicoccus sp. F390]MDT0574937.1 hypothetical protein [Croceicoccus sp. F390]